MAGPNFKDAFGKLNPGIGSRKRNVSLGQGMIIDGPTAIYRKIVQTSVGTDSLEGVSTLRAIVLRATSPNSEEDYLSRMLSFMNSDSDHAVIHLTCMIPEMHVHLGNPFDHFACPEEYVRQASMFPIYRYEPRGEGMTSEVGIGSIVEITFTDPGRKEGFVSRIIQPLDERPTGTTSSRQIYGNGDAIPLSPDSSAIYSKDSNFNPDDPVYPGSKYTWRMVTTTTKNLDNTPISPAHKQNLVNLVKNILEKLDNAGIEFKINSAYRSPEVNTAVTGSDNSFHKDGRAADLHFTGADKNNRKQQVKLFEEDIPKAIGSWHDMIIYEKTNHIHIGVGTQQKKLVKKKAGGYENWDQYRGFLKNYSSQGSI